MLSLLPLAELSGKALAWEVETESSEVEVRESDGRPERERNRNSFQSFSRKSVNLLAFSSFHVASAMKAYESKIKSL